MIQRTRWSLLSNLSYGFCKGKNFKDTKSEKEKPTNKYIQRNKSKQTGSNEQDVKDTKVQKTQTKNIKKQQDSYANFSLDKLNVDEAELQKFKQNNTIKNLFQNQYKQNTINQSLIKGLDNIDKQFAIKMSLYLQRDFFNAKQFYITNALPAQSNSKQASLLVSSTASQIIEKYIQQDDLQGLLTFTQILINQNKNNFKVVLKKNKILQYFQLILDIQNNLKYKIFGNLIQLANFKSNGSETSKKLQWLLNKTFQKYLKQFQGNQNVADLNKNFDQFIQNFITNISGKYTKSQLLLQALRALYFGKCNSYQSYDNFFKVIGQFKKITNSQDNLFEDFYRNFYYQLQTYRLSTTDCAESAFEVNQQLRQNYDKYVDNKNQLGILSIVAICLDNIDLTIPHKFLDNHSKHFQQIPTKLIYIIKMKYNLLRLLQNTNKDITNQQKNQVLALLLNKANNIQKLKLAIAVKDYEKAMQIFTKQYFKDNCIQKQRSIIKTVLFSFFFKQILHKLKGKQKSSIKQKIQNFVSKISNQYLWKSYQKREDLGYLLEDYYIREGEQLQVTKQEKRFSYWDTYFEIKRALQIKKFQMLGQLDTIRQPNQKPFLQSQFNLNQYLAGQKAERHRQVADYHQKRQSELEMYFNRVQYQLGQLKTSQNQQELKAKIAAYQNSLCEQNLKILQDFGLRGYDITVHDQQQFRNRIKQFHKSRGVFRLQSIYNRIFPNESQFQFLKQDHNRRSFKRQFKKPQKNKDQEQKLTSADQKFQEQEPQAEAEAATQQVSTKQESNQPVQQSQSAAQEQGQQQTQQSEQKPAVIHASTKDPIKEFLQQNSDLQQLTTEFVDLLRIKRRKQFAEAAINIKTRYLSQVNQLVRWGVLYKQPMAIYMSEKLAMITGQIISHNYAIRVSDYFSYYRQIDQSLLVDCKRCLSYIGKIQRQFIYDTNKVYHHIFYPKKFKNSTFKFNGQLKNRLQDLVIHNPYISRKFSEPRQIERKLRQSRPL